MSQDIASSPREPAIKLQAGVVGMKTLADGTFTLTLFGDADQLAMVMRMLEIKRDGDILFITARRINVKKIEVKDASKKPNNENKKIARRVKRYPYRD